MTSSVPPIDPFLARLEEQVSGWLEPLADAPSGQNLEYEIEFLEFSQAAEGKPETQFSAAEPPVWAEVIAQAETLFGRSRDLRLAVPWARAVVSTSGVAALPSGLRLLGGLLDNLWDSVYPELDPDDGDPFARTSLMTTLSSLDGLLGDVRNSALLRDRRLPLVRPRDVLVALGKEPARGEDEPLKLGQIQGLLAEHRAEALVVTAAATTALERLNALGRVMNDRFGIERSPDLKPLRSLLQDLLSVLPQPDPEPEPEDEPLADADASSAAGDGAEGTSDTTSSRRVRPGPMRIDTREDAVKAIQLVCDYLERHEPTNPAQFMLRRAQRLIDMNFLRLVREFAPDAMNEVARIMGVDPDVIRSED